MNAYFHRRFVIVILNHLPYFPQTDPSYFPGFCGDVLINGVVVGQIGLVHPEVITNFNLNNPAAALELNLEKVLEVTNFGHC